jgi:hypothetical protein
MSDNEVYDQHAKAKTFAYTLKQQQVQNRPTQLPPLSRYSSNPLNLEYPHSPHATLAR